MGGQWGYQRFTEASGLPGTGQNWARREEAALLPAPL